MCGRFTRHTPADALAEYLDARSPPHDPGPRYNIAPTDPVLAARKRPDAPRELVVLRWGLVPFWAKDPNTGYRMINARAETVADKPAFRAAFRRRRCLIPADGFYEWQATAGRKQPYYIRLANGEPCAFAGLWEHWDGDDGEVIESCTIVVTGANERLAPLHDRMPVILAPEDYGGWLDPGNDDRDWLVARLRPYPAEAMEVYPVSRRVSDPRNEGADLIEPVVAE